MRFIVIAQDNVVAVQRLLHELDVRDVQVRGQAPRATAPSPELLQELAAHGRPEAALIRLDKKYRKALEPHVQVKHVEKEFRPTDPLLRQWLLPPSGELVPHPVNPSDSFRSAVAASGGRLVLAAGALEHADKVPPHRFAFMAESAALLVRLANSENLGATRYWHEQHGVKHAGGGDVTYIYRIMCGDAEVDESCQDHLKSGDNTTAESAARVYFFKVPLDPPRVVVGYVGPHPASGDYYVDLVLETLPKR